jgi:hypothetical protein
MDKFLTFYDELKPGYERDRAVALHLDEIWEKLKAIEAALKQEPQQGEELP